MRKLYALALGAVIATASCADLMAGNEKTHYSGDPVIHPKAVVMPGRILVKLLPGQDASILRSVAEVLQAGTPQRVYPRAKAPDAKQMGQDWVDLTRIYELKFTAPYRIEAALKLVRGLQGIQYAEPRYMHKTSYTVNDPLRGQQRHLTRINAAAAWDIYKGDTSIVIGIVDSGTDIQHEDLMGSLAINYADPINGFDDDADGVIDNYYGADLAGAQYQVADPGSTSDGDPSPTDENNVHGTHVAGCAAATTDNGIGVTGTGFKCRIMPIKCAADNDYRANGDGYILTGYEGIVFAADHNCKVINCSWGGPGSSQYEQDIVNYAVINKNAMLVVAAGNDNTSDDFFPSSYDNILSVAASNSINDLKASFSNYNTHVGITAPGVDIFATYFKLVNDLPAHNLYQNLSGTSMASPVTAGAAALVRGLFPQLTPRQVAQQLRVTSDPIYTVGSNSRFVGMLGKGRLNMARALTEQTAGLVMKNVRISDHGDQYYQSGDTVYINASFLNVLFPSTANLHVTYTSSSANAVVVPSTEVDAIGVLGTNDSTTLDSHVLKIALAPTTTQDEVVNIKVEIEDGVYNDVAAISFTINSTYVTFAYNNIGGTVGSNGRIGFVDNDLTKGSGVKLLSWGNLLHEMGLITATNTGSLRVADAVRSSTGQMHSDYTPGNFVKPAPNTTTADHTYSGSYQSTELSSSFTHNTYVWEAAPDTNFFIYEYEVNNTGTTALTNAFTGFFADPDISGRGSEGREGQGDLTTWDPDNTMGYAVAMDSLYDNSGGPYFGIKLLTDDLPANFMPLLNREVSNSVVDLSNGFEDQEKYESISNGVIAQIQPSQDRADVSFSIGYGPFSLDPGATRKVAYAICVGYTMADLQAAAQKATIGYANLAAGVKTPAALAGVSLYPNPARQQLALSCPAGTKATIVDLRGSVQHVSSRSVAGGYSFDVSGIAPGYYMVLIQAADGQATVRRFVKE